LAGQGCSPDNAELADLLAREGVAASTILLGHRSDIGGLLNALDVLVIASAFGEAYPIVAIEATAVGTAIVATDVGDTAEFVCGDRYLVSPGDTAAMTQALDWMRSDLDTPALRAKLADKARETASRNSIEACAASYDRLYGTLLQ
jgi:glycosyltransferase involved in cell wall biosynthesis